MWNLASAGRVFCRSVELRVTEPNSLCYECVRWYRKPRWIPKAKTKLFRIPQRPNIPIGEQRELIRLNNNYSAQIRSIQHYFAEKTQSQTTATEVIEEQKRKEKEDYDRCVKENEMWNAEVAKLRESRLAKQEKETREEILRHLMEHEEQQKQLFEQAEAFVRQEKERSRTFITLDNIDEAIERALANPIDYNFAIDVEGNRYIGRTAHPGKTPPQQEANEVKSQAQN